MCYQIQSDLPRCTLIPAMIAVFDFIFNLYKEWHGDQVAPQKHFKFEQPLL